MDDPTSTKSPSPVQGIKRAQTVDETSRLHRRTSRNSFSNQSPHGSPELRQRRSSTLSDFSINGARRSLQSSTDEILLPTPHNTQLRTKHESHWDSAPLAFALFPAIGGIMFKNGSSVVTDITLLALAAIFLNWSVRIPWTWYHSAQEIRLREEQNNESIAAEDSFEDSGLEPLHEESSAVLEEQPEDVPTANQVPHGVRQLPVHQAAIKELYLHEVFALLSCFLFPVLGAYLLHTIRSQLSRPSEGLVSNYNLTIFLLASELRPMGHLVKLIQSRTLHLQRIVNVNPYASSNSRMIVTAATHEEIVRRLDALEARAFASVEGGIENTGPESSSTGKQSNSIATEVRRSLQPDLDALNRAVRRYEKRAMLQTYQTESKLSELESKINDAISLAAAAATSRHTPHGMLAVLFDWAVATVVLPLQMFATLASLPFRAAVSLIGFGSKERRGPSNQDRSRKAANGKYPANSRPGGDRHQSRILKR
ncbi:hypothetical protein F5884DRAFT_184590 [Xylogone sp. PMI_703]|nr:hypothetical protein F5884DRAFT_184590 [Xylogone sp. PMI_703]